MTRSVKRGVFGFGIAFFTIYLIYCILDSLFNYGRTFAEDITIWKTLYIHPTAMATGIGAAWLGILINKRDAYVSAIAGFLGYSLVSLAWHFFVAAPSTTSPQWDFYVLIAPLIEKGLEGIVVGIAIGVVQRGWKNSGWYAIAGTTGFINGWYINRVVAEIILIRSPLHGFISRVVVGSPLYFLYWLAPALLYGGVIGICLGAVTFLTRAKKPMDQSPATQINQVNT
jgi:hypothetical protein